MQGQQLVQWSGNFGEIWDVGPVVGEEPQDSAQLPYCRWWFVFECLNRSNFSWIHSISLSCYHPPQESYFLLEDVTFLWAEFDTMFLVPLQNSPDVLQVSVKGQ